MKRLKTISPVILFLFVLLVTNSCNKDKLTGDLEAFEGRYTWTHSLYKAEWWHSYNSIMLPADKGHTAEVEFTNTGKIIFYIDGEEIHKTGYSIESQDELSGVLTLTISTFKGSSKELDLNNNVRFTLSGDTLTVNDFPGGGYDESYAGDNYFSRN